MARFLGYKAFNKDLTCRDYQFEIGKTYEHKGKIAVCESGFHFCKSLVDCYQFYPMNENTRICKVEALGEVLTEDNVKYVTNKIKILSEIKKPRVASNLSESSSGYCNSGDWNSGNRNSGYCNSGDWNSGNRNSGDRNSGDWNSGNCNSGDRNSGNRNSGYCNSGYCNSGDWNSGNRNSGDWNSGNRNSGVFNSVTPTINMFNKPTNWTYDDWYYSRAYDVMANCPYTYSDFISESNMSDEEKENHPEYKTIGGYIKTFIVKQEDKQKWWDELDDRDKEAVRSLPNFDADVFKSCTGITVKE